jgi:tetratricopeptide (TPR) repeat protein
MLRQFLADDPLDDFSQYALALELEKEGQRSEALENLEIILKRNPGYLPAYYQSGQLYELRQEREKAARVYRDGLIIARNQNNQKTFNELNSALENLDVD